MQSFINPIHSRSNLTGVISLATPLRTVAINNRYNNAGDGNGSYKQQIFRTPYVLGTNTKDMTFLFTAWMVKSSGYNSGVDLTIVEASLESPDGEVVPITFDGNRNITVLAGNEVFCDTLYPSDFSLSAFDKDDSAIWWLKGVRTVPANGNNFPYNNNTSVNDISGGQTAFYNPANTTISSTDIAGQYTSTGTNLFSRSANYTPILLGHPVIDEPSWVMVGDSIGGGLADGSPLDVAGKSFFNRALFGDGGTDTMSGINLSTGGTNSSHYIDESHIMSLYKYARFAVENHAANEMSGLTLAQAQTRHTDLWQNFRDEGIEAVLAVEPFARSTSSDSFASESNQTYYGDAWSPYDATTNPDGVVDQYETWLQTQIGGALDNVVSTSTARDSSLPRKWKSDGTAGKWTTDGLHPRYQGNKDVADVMAPIMRNYT